MFQNQQYNESRSIWDPRDTMQASSEIRSSSLRESQVMPQYSTNNRETQQYRQAWIVEGSQNNEIKSPNK